MSTPRVSKVLALAAIGLGAGGVAIAAEDPIRWFADRPVAWSEHDDEHVPRSPAPTHLQELDRALLLRDGIAGEMDRVMKLEKGEPALDVNALDEVPCSTWFCPRNHLTPMLPEEVAAGPIVASPRLPLRVTRGKDLGATAGFQVIDADGRKFAVKLDPAGLVGLTTGPEMIGQRLFHAAGYNVPGAFLVDAGPDDLLIGDGATYLLYRVQARPLTADLLRTMLDKAGRLPDGRWRLVATPWIPGRILGGFDMKGRREDDPNDRIPHQHRRALRASWALFAWLAEMDPGSINSLDSYVEEGGRRFVRHYFIDFGATLGSSTAYTKSLTQTGEHLIEVGRSLRAFFSLGFYRRPFQDARGEWERMVKEYPVVGWFPAEAFNPDHFRTNRKVPAHAWRTDRDLYWGAKVVTSFTDPQLAAVVKTAGFPARERDYVEHALRVRRDIMGRRYLRAVAAVEKPEMASDGAEVCFLDLAIARRYAVPEEMRYAIEISDGRGGRLGRTDVAPTGDRTCVPLGAGAPGTGYRVVEVESRFVGTTPGSATVSKASRIHLRWRAGEGRFVVVGLERDE